MAIVKRNSSRLRCHVRTCIASPDILRWYSSEVSFYWHSVWPKDLHVEPFKESYNYGNRLRCWGDGGLILTYRWIYSATGAVTNGSYLIIDDTMAQNVFHVYECIAVHEKSHRTISKTVNITITDPSARGEYLTSSSMKFRVSVIVAAWLLPHRWIFIYM